MTPVVVIDSDDEPNPSLFRERRPYSLSFNRQIDILDDSDSDTLGEEEPEVTPQSPDIAGFDNEDFMTDEAFDQFLTGLSRNAARSRRAEPAPPVRTIVHEYTAHGRTYRRGKSVELQNGSFLKIQEIIKDGSNEVFLRGWRFERLEEMETLVPQRKNEVCQIIDLLPGQTHPAYDQVPLTEVKGMRIIRVTNRRYQPTTDTGSREDGLLVCRLKYIRIWEKVSGRGQKTRISEEALVFLTQDEANPGHGIAHETLRWEWRGETQLGGTFTDENRPFVYDLSSTIPTAYRQRQKVQTYTFGDGFCGAGGISRGAAQAGLRVQWGFDICPKAMDTYRLNFPTAVGETCSVENFLTNALEDIVVDILHFSPPCQTFSPAHTISSANDDANEACIFSTRELLARVKPRIVTMEETSGLKDRHKEFLYATIHNFVDLGYSIRWKLLSCQDYGVPQKRKRLVIIGSW
jgi:DNA (cytosine-5)-methyltransferase 1